MGKCRADKIGYCEWIFAVHGPLGMKIASEVGYQGIQLMDLGGSEAKYPLTDPRVAQGYLEASEMYGVELHSLHLYTLVRQGFMLQPWGSAASDEARESMRNGVKACDMMGVKRIMVSSFFDTTVRSDYDFDNFAKHLNALCDMARDSGIAVSFECVMPIDRIMRMIESSKCRARVCYDIHNPLRYGSGVPVDEIKRLGRENIDHVHLKDAPEDFGVRCLLGQGCVGYDKAMACLNEVGYHGWYITENYYERNPRRFPGGAYSLFAEDLKTIENTLDRKR